MVINSGVEDELRCRVQINAEGMSLTTLLDCLRARLDAHFYLVESNETMRGTRQISRMKIELDTGVPQIIALDLDDARGGISWIVRRH